MCATVASGNPWVSTDSGTNWTERPIPSNSDVRYTAYTRDGSKLFVSTGASKAFQSTDDGVTWTQIVTAPGSIGGICVSDDGLKVLLTFTSNAGVYVGTYSGSWSWVNYLNGVDLRLNRCSMSGDGTKMAIATTGATLRYSTNSGVTWTTPTGAIASVTINDVVIAQDGSRYTAISSNTLYTTTNPGSTWSSQAISGTNIYIAGSSTLGKIYTSRLNNFMLTGTIPPEPIICFREGSKICVLNPMTGAEEYVAVENLRPGTLVKTHMSGYVPVSMIGTSTVTIPEGTERTSERLYVCSKEQFPELTGDLYITGRHSILVDSLTGAEREACAVDLGRVYVTEGKYRLPAHIARRTRVYEAPGAVERIWHFALDNNDEQMNYGVYANGLLVESCSIWRLRTMVGYELMTGNVYTVSAPQISVPPARLPIVC